jgi:hypothetical protein
MDNRKSRNVKRRRVFYIPGYDPIPPRRYRELYRTEGAKQAEISGYELSLTAKSGERFGWRVHSDIDGSHTDVEMDVLVWSDIVQDSMDAGLLRTYVTLAHTAWVYISTGALFRLRKLRRGPIYAALYPVVSLLLQLCMAIGAMCAVATSLRLCVEAFGVPAFGLPAWLLGAGSGYGLLRWFKRQDGKVYVHYLMHDYGFSARWRGANPPKMKARLHDFQGAIHEALHEDWDEVLVVGHSSGAHLGVSILADVIREGGVPQAGPALSFLSLGHVVPMVSFLPEATELRRDLAYLSTRDELFWLDVSAPSDPCSFALCDPVKTANIAPEGQKWPLVISAAFTQSLSPELWATFKWRFFRRHFQYLCAFDRPMAYDYFKITAGPQTLTARFEAHAPTPSRIDTPANRFTEMAQ